MVSACCRDRMSAKAPRAVAAMRHRAAGAAVGAAGAARRRLRLTRQQRGGHADQHERGGDSVGQRPGLRLVEAARLEPRRQGDHACGRHQQPDPVGGNVAGHAGRLLLWRQALDAIGIDDDVLRCRCKGNQQGSAAHDQGARQRIARAEKDDGAHRQQLRGQQPAAPAAEPARQPRRVKRIDDGRPQKFDRVGQTGKAEKANGAEIDAAVGQPQPQRFAGQRQGKTARKSKQQHDQHARAQIDCEGAEEALCALTQDRWRRLHGRAAKPLGADFQLIVSSTRITLLARHTHGTTRGDIDGLSGRRASQSAQAGIWSRPVRERQAQASTGHLARDLQAGLPV